MTYQGKILPLVIEPDPRLHIVSKAVESVTDDIRNLMNDMLVTMYSSQGIGLAAVQVGLHIRVVVIDIDQDNSRGGIPLLHDGKPIFMVNPEIVDKSEATIPFREGCLSLPTVSDDVIRYEWIVVEYLDYDGKMQRKKFDGLLSICAQHEIDHTNGIVFIDHLSQMKKSFWMKKLLKLRKHN
jgi:peptide deformylase